MKENFPLNIAILSNTFTGVCPSDENCFVPQSTYGFEDVWTISRNYDSNQNRMYSNRNEQTKDRNVVTWLNARTPCVTRKIHYAPHDVISRQNMYLKIEKLQKFLYIWVMIHQPGHLIQRIGSTQIEGMMSASAMRLKVPNEYRSDRGGKQ